jgi:DNA-binding MarR family transcriptional regulator
VEGVAKGAAPKTRTPRPPSLDRDAEALYLSLQRLFRIRQERDADLTCAWGVTRTECHALELLAQRGGSTLNQLAEGLQLDKSTASRAVASLITRELVTRGVDTTDARAVRLDLTAKGRELYDSLSTANTAAYAGVLRRLPKNEREALIAALDKAAELLGELDIKG